MLIDFTKEELGCILFGLTSWPDEEDDGLYNTEEINICESIQSKIEKALQIQQISCNCKDHDRVEAGDCPAGRWWWVCSNCGKKV